MGRISRNAPALRRIQERTYRVKDLRNVVAFGTSEGTAEFTGFHVAQIWARDNVKISIKASGYAYITVDIADRAEVEITASDAARVVYSFTAETTREARPTTHGLK